MKEPSVTEILEKVLNIARSHHDDEIIKWVSLELEGYHDSNQYLTDDVIVPKYREIPGQWHDHYGKTLIVPPEAPQELNLNRLRHAVPELEELFNSNKTPLVLLDNRGAAIIQKYFNVTVHRFIFGKSSLAAVLNSIKQEAIRRVGKYVSRDQLLTPKLIETIKDKQNDENGEIMKDNSNSKNFWKILWGIIVGIILIIGFLWMYHQMLSSLDQRIENKVLNSEFIKNLASYVRPTLIFDNNAAILIDMGGKRYIDNIKVETIKKADKNAGELIKITISPKEYIAHEPILSPADANQFGINKINRMNNIDIEYIIERIIVWESEDQPAKYRLEIIPK
jgi:hypothetical protein